MSVFFFPLEMEKMWNSCPTVQSEPREAVRWKNLDINTLLKQYYQIQQNITYMYIILQCECTRSSSSSTSRGSKNPRHVCKRDGHSHEFHLFLKVTKYKRWDAAYWSCFLTVTKLVIHSQTLYHHLEDLRCIAHFAKWTETSASSPLCSSVLRFTLRFHRQHVHKKRIFQTRSGLNCARVGSQESTLKTEPCPTTRLSWLVNHLKYSLFKQPLLWFEVNGI